MFPRTLALLLAVGMAIVACGSDGATDTSAATTTTLEGATTTNGATPTTTATTSPGEEVTLTLVSHDSFSEGVTPDTFAPFSQETGITVEVLPAGDAGALVNQAILTKDNPVADVLFGVDDTFLSRALDADLFVPYESSALGEVPDDLVLDPRHRVTPIDFGDVCLNYDKAAFVTVAPPSTLDQLVDETYRGLLVTESPATSSPGLAFLLATIARYGDDGWRDYWRALVANDVQVVSDWDTAYYSEFTRYGGGRSLVVSYASSPPAEVIFSEESLDEAPTGVMTDGCYRQIEFAGVVQGTEHPDEAGRLIDYMLSSRFQEQIPLTWFVFPANEQVELPPEFVEFTVVPENPARVDPAVIDTNRETWIEEWTEIVQG